MTKHSPEPWAIREIYKYGRTVYLVVDKNDMTVAEFNSWRNKEDARMLVAAPKMLRALQAVVSGILNGVDQDGNLRNDYDSSVPTFDEVETMVLAAIAAAKGESK